MILFLSLIIAEGVLGQSNCEQGSGYIEIVGDADAPNLYGNELLLPAQAATTPQFLKISGVVNFTLDYTFAPGSDIIFLDNSSGFRVDIFAELTLNDVKLRGCNKLWMGVEVRPLASIVADASTFEDAIAAIILRDRSTIRIVGNTFKKNACGILAIRGTSTVTPISVLLASSDGLSGNTFDGSEQLLESISPSSLPGVVGESTSLSSFPIAGIVLQRVIGLTIGSNNHAANMFENFFMNPGPRMGGIRLYESGATVTNCNFQNFGDYNAMFPTSATQGEAISAYSALVALPDVIVENCDFFNCYQDIFSRGTNLTVKNISSKDAVVSIRARSANFSQNPFVCQIQGNKIDDFYGFGIQVEVIKPIALDISDNELTDNVNPFGASPRRGIYVRKSGMVTPNVNLNGSMIYNNSITSGSVFFMRS